MKVNGKDSLVIYRGADDNASGVAVCCRLPEWFLKTAICLSVR